jgi:predicted enzyme related to lactoylglutathione lyase
MTDSTHKTWWHELNTWEPESALAFYTRAMGWQFEPVALLDRGAYWVASDKGRPVCGIYELTEPDYDGVPSHWMTYLSVDNIERVVRETTAMGGELVRVPVKIEGVGRLAVVMDSGGAMIGLIQGAGADSMSAVAEAA